MSFLKRKNHFVAVCETCDSSLFVDEKTAKKQLQVMQRHGWTLRNRVGKHGIDCKCRDCLKEERS